jgi:flagellar hook-associated protein 2
MTTPVANFSGVASGIDWSGITDQLIAVDKSQTVTPITDQITAKGNQKTAWTTFQGLLNNLNDSARTLRAGGIGGNTATASLSAATGRSVVGVTASSTATAGNYSVEVLQLAQAAKISGSARTSTSTALNLSGDFAINGKSISVAASDTLDNIRTRINDANTGASPTGVTATILSDGTGGGRLVLTRDSAGGSDINLTDGSGGLSAELGFVDSRSKSISSTTAAIATSLGLSVSPPPATMIVDGHMISVDLSTDSIATIIAKINAAGGQASAVADTNGGTSGFRIAADGNVKANPNDPNSQAVVDALGFAAGQTAAVSQQVTTQKFTDGSDATATSSTLLTSLKVGGVASNLAAGDAINVKGVRGDGTAVSLGITVSAGDTLQALVDKINNSTNGFGSGARTAHATVGDDGAIHLTDDTGGDSRLSLSLSAVKADNTAANIGTTSLSSVGRQRQVSVAQDAQFRVDGVLLTRGTNTVSDAINGVTLSLQNAEEGTKVNVNVAKDNTSAVKSIQDFATAYNNVVSFFENQRGDPTAALYANSTLRGTVGTLTNALRTQVAGNSTYSSLSIAGVALDKNGVLQVDTTKLQSALNSKPTEIESLFGFGGVGGALVTATDNATQFGTGTISTTLLNIDDSTRRLQSRADDASARLDLKRQQLVAQYANLESLLGSLNAQGASLKSSIAGLTPTR